MQRLRIEDYRHAGLARLTFVLVAQQVLVGNDVGPMVPTGVMHTEQHWLNFARPANASSACAGRGNTEHDDTRRQTWRRFGHVANALDEALMHTRAALCHAFGTDIVEQRTP